MIIDPNQFRWDPKELPDREGVDFVDGLQLYCGAGDPSMKNGISIYLYSANTSMEKKACYNSDGDFLIVPQEGPLAITTECGRLLVEPTEIVVIPRGVKFSISLSQASRGYVAEIFDGHFEIPNLGPIGSNGLANPRDFAAPVAWFEDVAGPYIVMNKFMNQWFQTTLDHSPFNVVAWHGNYFPFKYDLKLFNCINSVSFDHPDPSIYTVLTCQSNDPGTAVLDFVIFPPRWMVAQHTFRPPWFHRNCMSEFMGMIYGKYDAKVDIADASGKKRGFSAGGASLHSCMTPHGPDGATFLKASTENPQNPVYFADGLAFMFESTFLLKVSEDARSSPLLQESYSNCWSSLPKLFTGDKHITLT